MEYQQRDPPSRIDPSGAPKALSVSKFQRMPQQMLKLSLLGFAGVGFDHDRVEFADLHDSGAKIWMPASSQRPPMLTHRLKTPFNVAGSG